MVVPFPGSPRPTLGVEWEIALVDRVTRDLSNTAAEVFDAVANLAGPEDPRITKELLRNTVELVTGIHSTVGEAMDDLDESLDLLRRAANPLGVDLICAGTHPFAQWSTQLVTRTPDYDELIERTQCGGAVRCSSGGVCTSTSVCPRRRRCSRSSMRCCSGTRICSRCPRPHRCGPASTRGTRVIVR